MEENLENLSERELLIFVLNKLKERIVILEDRFDKLEKWGKNLEEEIRYQYERYYDSPSAEALHAIIQAFEALKYRPKGK